MWVKGWKSPSLVSRLSSLFADSRKCSRTNAPPRPLTTVKCPTPSLFIYQDISRVFHRTHEILHKWERILGERRIGLKKISQKRVKGMFPGALAILAIDVFVTKNLFCKCNSRSVTTWTNSDEFISIFILELEWRQSFSKSFRQSSLEMAQETSLDVRSMFRVRDRARISICWFMVKCSTKGRYP